MAGDALYSVMGFLFRAIHHFYLFAAALNNLTEKRV